MNAPSPLLFIGLVLNSLITLYMYNSDQYEVIAPFSLGAVILSIIGLILILFKKIKIGSIVFIIGCVPFVPLGIIGILGAKKVINNKKEEAFIEKEYGSN